MFYSGKKQFHSLKNIPFQFRRNVFHSRFLFTQNVVQICNSNDARKTFFNENKRKFKQLICYLFFIFTVTAYRTPPSDCQSHIAWTWCATSRSCWDELSPHNLSFPFSAMKMFKTATTKITIASFTVSEAFGDNGCHWRLFKHLRKVKWDPLLYLFTWKKIFKRGGEGIVVFPWRAIYKYQRRLELISAYRIVMRINLHTLFIFVQRFFHIYHRLKMRSTSQHFNIQRVDVGRAREKSVIQSRSEKAH